MFDKNKDHIVRYCKPSQLDDDGTILISAFTLRKADPILGRPEDEKTLSVDNYDYFKENQYGEVKFSLESRLKIKDNARLALLSYKDVAEDIKNNMHLDIDIRQDSECSHCTIMNLYGNDIEAATYFCKNIIEAPLVKDV